MAAGGVATRWAYGVSRRALTRYRHRLPTIRTGTRQRGEPVIYLCAPDYDVPSGGIRVMYRHVDLLNKAGVPAAVLHRRPGFRCSWFDNQTRVVDADHTVLGPQDLLVVTELDARLLLTLPPGCRHAVFNQNPHLTWQRINDPVLDHYLTSPDLAGILTVSEHSVRLLRHAFGGAAVLRVHNSVDPELFYPGGERRPRTIAYMPRRGKEEARQVLGILRSRRVLDGWNVIALDGLTEHQVGAELRSAALFLSFAHHEGFGLPAAEAMACGCYVVGFDGFGGEEFFRPAFSAPVAAGDVLAFARAVERVVHREQLQPGWCAARARAAASFIAGEYSVARERSDVLDAYRRLMSGAPSVWQAPDAAEAGPPLLTTGA